MGWKWTKDGRLKLTQPHYDAMKMVLCAQQDGKCSDCGSAMRSDHAHLHHLAKRGMGGGKREDWIGNDSALVEAAQELVAIAPFKTSPEARAVLEELYQSLRHAKVTTVTLLCPPCHVKRHP